jgi:hypothetical protein
MIARATYRPIPITFDRVASRNFGIAARRDVSRNSLAVTGRVKKRRGQKIRGASGRTNRGRSRDISVSCAPQIFLPLPIPKRLEAGRELPQDAT